MATKVTLIWLPRNCSSHKQCSPKAELPHYFQQPANQSRMCPPLLITAIVMLRDAGYASMTHGRESVELTQGPGTR